MKDPILLNKLWKEVERGNVNASTSGALTIFKYTQGCHIENRWNDVNRQARGIIFDVDGTVVARPFSKFFNLNERPETEVKNLPWNESVEVYEKLDGSCGAGYYYARPAPGEEAPPYVDGVCAGYLPTWKLATPGSMESDQAIEGTKILNESGYKLQHLPKDCTPVFEIIYPENRIVVDYHGARELVLLAIFEHNGVEWHPHRVDQIAELCGFRRPRRFDIDLREEIPFEENAEGYVARFESGLRVKVKSPVYLRIHRLLDHLSPKGVIELIRGNEYGAVLAQLPKEIAKDFDDVRAHVQGMFNDVKNRAERSLFEMPVFDNRKDQALWIQANVDNELTGLVFGLLDQKDIEYGVWRIVQQKVKDETDATYLGD